LSGDEVMTPDSVNPGKATADRMAVAPILPVPHTATRRIRLTIVPVLRFSWQTSHRSESPVQEAQPTVWAGPINCLVT